MTSHCAAPGRPTIGRPAPRADAGAAAVAGTRRLRGSVPWLTGKAGRMKRLPITLLVASLMFSLAIPVAKAQPADTTDEEPDAEEQWFCIGESPCPPPEEGPLDEPDEWYTHNDASAGESTEQAAIAASAPTSALSNPALYGSTQRIFPTISATGGAVDELEPSGLRPR